MRMVEALRHSPNLRESDGAILWKMLMQRCRGFEDTVTWTFGDWMTCLDNGTDQLRFEYCLGRNRDIQYMRSVQGHSGGQKIDLQNNVLLPSVWSDCMYHEGSSFEWRSMSHCRRNRSSRRTTDMLLNSRSLAISMLTIRHEPNKPRKNPYKLTWRRMHSAVYWFDLRLAQRQTIYSAIMVYDSMLTECLLKLSNKLWTTQKPRF